MDPVDKALVTEDPLGPSSGFRSRVMDAVLADQTKLLPTPFPWSRFAVGVFTCAVWAAATAVISERIDWSAFAPLVSVVQNRHVVYGALAVAGSLVVVAIPRLRRIE